MSVTNIVQDEIEETFACIDENGDHSISFEEFASVMLEIDHAKSESALHATFDTLDMDHDGCVSLDDFRAWCS